MKTVGLIFKETAPAPAGPATLPPERPEGAAQEGAGALPPKDAPQEQDKPLRDAKGEEDQHREGEKTERPGKKLPARKAQ